MVAACSQKMMHILVYDRFALYAYSSCNPVALCLSGMLSAKALDRNKKGSGFAYLNIFEHGRVRTGK